jgi:hypothetical protein
VAAANANPEPWGGVTPALERAGGWRNQIYIDSHTCGAFCAFRYPYRRRSIANTPEQIGRIFKTAETPQ